MKKRYVIIIASIIVLILLKQFLPSHNNQNTFYIGLAGPMSGDYGNLGQDMLKSAELAMEEINNNMDLRNIKLKLAVIDDHSDPTTQYRPLEAAKKMVKQENLLSVVGHFFSVCTMAATPIYEKHEIPVITPTSTQPEVTGNSRWVYSVIFNDAFQSSYIAKYVIHGLRKNRIAIIHEDIPYGQSLRRSFLKELLPYKIKPFVEVGIQRDGFNPRRLKKYNKALKQVDVIFLATRYELAADVVKYFKSRGITADFIGGESIGSNAFILDAGISAEGVYAVNPFLVSLYGKEARDFYSSYQHIYMEKPSWIATYTYEAFMLLAKAIKKVGPNRDKIRSFLNQMTSPDRSLSSIGGNIYFDHKGANRRLIAIGQVRKGEYFPAKFQFSNVKYPHIYEDLEKSGQLFELDNNVMKRRFVVYTGIYVQEIEEFNIEHSNFKVNFNLWFQWHGDSRKEIEFKLVDGNIDHIEEVESYHNESIGDHYLAYKIRAHIKDEFPLYDYPLDHQILRIRIMPKSDSIESMIFVPDLTNPILTKPNLDFGTWENYKNIAYVNKKTKYLSFQNPKFTHGMLNLDYSVFHFDMFLKRNLQQYILKFLPLLLLLLVSSSIFFITSTMLASRIAISITTLLSSMAFHMSQSSHLGNVGYTTKVDEFFIVTYFLIFITITENVAVGYLKDIQKDVLCKQLDLVSRYIYPLLIVGGFLMVFVF
jgi:ABC-type branched-subunit amino acid transport system substrate-binding protein